MNDLKHRIAQYRARMSLSATQFGRELERDRQSVYAWENGTTIPSADVLLKLAKLGIITQDEALQIIGGSAA